MDANTTNNVNMQSQLQEPSAPASEPLAGEMYAGDQVEHEVIPDAPAPETTAMSRGLIRADKLHRLPPELQTLVAKMTPDELAHLLAVVSPHNHFDFLGLPEELRCLIYKYVLGTSNGWLVRDGHQSRRHPGLSLLRVSKAIYREAYAEFTRLNGAKLRLDRAGAHLSDKVFPPAVKRLRRIKIAIPTGWLVQATNGLRLNKYNAAAKVMSIVNMLNASYSTGSSPVIKVDFCFDVDTTPYHRIRLRDVEKGILHPEQTFLTTVNSSISMSMHGQWHVQAFAGFIQAQLSHLMSEARAKLHSGLQVELASNADQPVQGVEVIERIDEKRILFRMPAFNVEGYICLGPGQYTAGPGQSENMWPKCTRTI